MKKRITPTKQGFTLMELLVALTVMGILTASIAGVLQNATASVEKGSQAMDQLTRVRSLERVLGDALRDARAVELSSEEKRLLEEEGDYDSADGEYRFRGEPYALGFCLEHPFLRTERDGYMHWVVLDVRVNESSEQTELWMTDTSFLMGVDNPVGEDWGDNALFSDDAQLPSTELCLIRDAEQIEFFFYQLDQEDNTSEPETYELEEEEVEGDYASEVPDYIEMMIQLPKMDEETLVFDFCVKDDDA